MIHSNTSTSFSDLVEPSKSKSPAFQFYPKDYLADVNVREMSHKERGIYWELVCYCWLQGSLPADPIRLAKIVGMTSREFARHWPAISPCFREAEEAKLAHPRLEIERKRQSDRRQRMSDGGKRSAELRSQGASKVLEATLVQKVNSSSSSSSSSPVREARAPIHDTSHRKHAHCGRVCLHAGLFGEFVRRRNHAGADTEIRAWAMEVERQWSEGGPFADDEPGDAFEFWKARYAERWPATGKAGADAGPRSVSTEEHPYAQIYRQAKRGPL